MEDNAAELDDQLQQTVAPELARYQQLLELMKDESRRVALGEEATKVRERFALKRVSEQWMDLFEEVRR